MSVDDLWYLRERSAEGKLVPSSRHGRGKRWRVRYTDAASNDHARLFEKKREADEFDARCRAGVATEASLDQSERRIAFKEYAERWEQSRKKGWTGETRRRVPANLRNHLFPAFGDRLLRSVTLTDVLEWLSVSLDEGVAKSSLKLYFELLKTIMNAAVTDKLLADNPCAGVKLSQILRGISRAPKWVPTEDEVLALLDVVPDRFRAAIWLGAGQGLRLGEVLGVEKGPRCADFLRRELHVVQQLRNLTEYGGFVLCTPKSGSVGTAELDETVAIHLSEHMRQFPPVAHDVLDILGDEPKQRKAELLFTTVNGNRMDDRRWSEQWARWRKAAGWPKTGTFHSLRHFFATTLITNGVDPQEVQKAMRHASLRITLETYVHWWPKKDRPKGVVSGALSRARADRDKEQDQKRLVPDLVPVI